MGQRTGELEQELLPKPGEVFVFSEQNFEGRNWSINRNTPYLGADISVTSIRIGPQTGVTIFSDENYGGVSQDLTTELAAFTDSRLGKDLKPKSFKIWSAVGKKFTGYWAIEIAEGQYLSVGPDGVLTTSPKVSEKESFRIKDMGPTPGMVAFTVRDNSLEKARTSGQSQSLTITELQNVALHNEPEAGSRKFSLLASNGQWIYYKPDEKRFLTTAIQQDRMIFCQAIKIAEDESQVGELHQGEVALYENRAYWGKVWLFFTDCADFANIVGLTKKVSSIQLGLHTGVTIYSKAQFNANEPESAKQDVTSNLPSLEYEQVTEDQISSMRFWKIVSHEGTGISFTCKLSQDFKGSGESFEEYSAYLTTLRLPSQAKFVDIWATDKTKIEVGAIIHHVSEDQPVRLLRNPTTSLVISMDATASSKGSLSTPGLKIRTDSMSDYERIVIYPDQAVHERLANLDNAADEEDEKKDTLWNANYVSYQNGKRIEHSVIKDRSEQKKKDVSNAQSMITKVMSTVKYSGVERTISPETLLGKAWVLDFLTYRVTADTLWVREAPDPKSKRIGYLRKNDIVEVLGFNVGAGWTRLRRTSDGLTGWSSSTYLSQIPETSTQGEQYRVTATALNVRKGPGAEFSIRGHLKHDEIVTAIGVNDKGTWRKIVTGEGLIGWSSARYMTLLQPPSPKPPSLVATKPEEIKPADRGVAPLKMVLPATSELSPQVNFREIRQEEIQALLARAESPDSKLAQDIWSDIGDAFESAGSFFVTAFEETVAFVIDIAGRAIKWIVDTTEKAIAIVEGIIEKIGAAIEEIIKWLRYLFDWEDILDTRDYLKDSILNALDYAGQTLPQKAKPIHDFLEDKQDLILGWIDTAIETLGGSPTDTSSGNSFSGVQTPEALDWIVSKVMGAFGSLGTSNIFDLKDPPDPAAETRLQTLWQDMLLQGVEMVSDFSEGLLNIIMRLVEHPDDPRQALVALLQMLRDQLEGMLKMGEKMILGLFELAGYLCAKIKEILSADLYLPLISDLLGWVGELLGISLDFSVLDVATLILAIPVTIISKVTLGEAPFKTAPALALSLDSWGIVAGVAGCVGAGFSIFLDVKIEMDEPGKVDMPQPWWDSILELLCLVFAIVGVVATGKGVIWELADKNSDAELQERPVIPISLWLLVYDVVILVLDFASIVPGIRKMPPKVERFKRGDKNTVNYATYAGLFHLTLLVIRDFIVEKKVKDPEDFLDVVPDYLMTLPEIGSFFRATLKQPVLAPTFALIDGAAAAASIWSIS